MNFNQKVDTLFAVADRKCFFLHFQVFIYLKFIYIIFLFNHLILHLELYYFFELRDVGDFLSLVSCSAQAIFEPYAAERDGYYMFKRNKVILFG